MAKGRKKKAGKRTPSGQLSRSASAILERGERDVGMMQPHRAWLPEASRLDQRAESELGRIYLAGHISEPQCWAGEKWRGIVQDYGAAHSCARLTWCSDARNPAQRISGDGGCGDPRSRA